ncbi:amino acid permease [Rhizocola hellebori]|uniref:Amino acid permease n=1 Tax=Rhizocola hellebori TaxID=1392758 RepID=A0A8J3VCZ4_9ACTN|nr:APC family permease [Rhizocola hellebori]GIH02052.1 amino acid permease [Rhizocola hellebori]
MSSQPLRGSLTTPRIVFLVVAAAAPLAAMVGTVPLAFAIGNGAGVPATFVLAGLALLCFSVGYAAMSRKIVNTGGFYTYLARGLGKPPAVAGGLVAVIAYNALTVGLVGAFGYFVQLIASDYGVNLPWYLFAGIGLALLAFFGYRQIDLSARVLSVVMLAEIGILTVLAIAIVAQRGAAAFPLTTFDPKTFLAPGLGVALMFALISYVGFESAALYGEESRNPTRSVPRATYASISVITVFYALISWVAVGAIGVAGVTETATSQQGELFFTLSGDFLGQAATVMMQILLCTSLFGSTLALHNGANRYMYVLGRERVLPQWLSGVHHSRGVPHRASMAQVAITALIVAIFALAGLHPYTNLATSMLGLGTLGVVALQCAAAVSVLGFFRNRPDRHWWRTGLAPVLGLIGLGTAGVLLVQNFAIVTGTTSPIVNLLPWLLVIAAVAGVAYAWWMRANDPQRYHGLAETPARQQERETPLCPLWPEPALINGNQRYANHASSYDRSREGAQPGRRSHA